MNTKSSTQADLISLDVASATEQSPVISWRIGLDWSERLALLGFYIYFIWRLMPGSGQNLLNANWLLIISESLVILLLLVRRQAVAISFRPTDWLLAVAATVLPLSITTAAQPGQYINPLVCAIVMFCGITLQLRAKIALGRSFGLVAADRGIKRCGPYQLVRHPIYVGYVIVHIGFFLLHPTVWNASVYSFSLILQILRILAEERFLAQNAEYREYMQSVRYRLIPGIF